MSKTKPTNSARATLVCTLVVIPVLLLSPAPANAQWTTPNGSGNINNTNTNNVGINTTTPGERLTEGTAGKGGGQAAPLAPTLH